MQKTVHFLKNNLKLTFKKREWNLILALSFLCFFFFGVFTLIVRSDILRSFDFNTTVRLQNHIPLKFDDFFSILSVTGRFEFSIAILLLLFLFKRKITAVIAIGFFGVAHLVEIVGKTFLTQPGPPQMFLRTTTLSKDFPGLFVHTDASYPSGHSLRIVFIAIIIILLIWKSKKIPAFLKYSITGITVGYMCLMLLSRVSLGEHWTTDVIGGSLLGAGFAFFSLLFL